MSAWSDAVAATSPYLWWKLNETSGTVAADSSGNGLSGTYSSATLNQPGLIPGDAAGKSVALATTSANIAKTSGLSYPDVGVTYALTFKSSGAVSGRFWPSDGNNSYLNLTTNTQGVLKLTTQVALGYNATALFDGTPHLVIYVVRATSMELWVDGVMVGSGTHALSAATRTAMQAKQSFSEPQGTYDDIVLWTSPLTTTQIGNLSSAWVGGAAAANVSLAGTRQARTAAFAAATVLAASLAGTMPAKTAAFNASTVASASLAGTRQPRTAAFAAATVVDGSLAGTRQAKTGAFAVEAVDPGAALDTALDGQVSPKTAAFTLDTIADAALAGVASGKTAAFTLDTIADAALAGVASGKTAEFVLDTVADNPAQTLDLSTFVDLYASTTYDGTGLVGTSKSFTFPIALDPATAYTIELDIEGDTDTGGALYSALGATQADVDNSYWHALGSAATVIGGTGTLSFAIGPGISGWDAAVAAGEHHVVFHQIGPSRVTAIRITPPIDSAAAGTPAVLAGTLQPKIAQVGVYVVAPVVSVPIVAAGHSVVVAQAFGPVTITGTQPVYTVSEESQRRARTRILVGNQDVTYWRNTLTPPPSYTLVEPMLYGPASIEFPQVAACFEEPGKGDLYFMHPGATVEVQRVLDDVVIGTDYKGVVTDYDTSGRALTVNVGGELQGRAELVNRQPVIFPRINDLGHQIADSVRDLGLPHDPPLGAVTGIEMMTSGGVGHLEHLQGLVSMAHTRSGAQWTVMPDKITGVYETHRKDVTTVNGTVFLDDAKTVANLRRDISEEPNRIFVTCVTPEGQRVRFGAYPGLIQGPVPDFPGSMFLGSTGEGVRLLIGKLHAVGYLRLKDVAGGYDDDVMRAVMALQADAGIYESGEVNQQTWNALYDLGITGQSLEWANIQPAAQRSKVRKWNRSATGTIMGFNPDYEPERLVRDRNIDLGAGITRDQAREFARTVIHDSDDSNWTGTIAFHAGALVKGEGFEGMTVTNADVMDARRLKPGMNLLLPQFAGGILVHISAIEVSGAGLVTATVDTRARDALEVWEVIARNRESRNDPTRHRIRKARSSSMVKDSIGEWDEIGGLLGIDVPLEAGWNVFKVVGAAEGTIARIRIALTEPREFACAVFGRDVDAGFLNDTVADPLTQAGQRAWRRKTTRKALREHGILYSAGTPEEPCGYGADIKSDGAELTGVHDDDAQWRYASQDRTVLHVAVYVRPAGAGAKVEMGRILWPQLEAGV